ncbi:ABC transporter ATP-binding protein [Gottschalkiaceae bacterium SANA]|nr:ABC transporter ATP-binding protein [Gottschalkiaceae bacterium SANA]
MENDVLRIENVTKTIKGKSIIKGIDFKIKAGEIFGFLGPNGAGKSTTLRMIVGLSKPTTGRIIICGYSISNNYMAAMQHVGCIIENPDLYDYISGYKNLEMLASMSKNVGHYDLMATVVNVGMENRIHDKVSTYSLGMKQRLGLAQALMHHPDLLVLDEPMNGLDPQGIYMFRMLIKRLAEQEQIAVLVSSHLISEVQLLCDRVAIINDGLIIKDTPINELIPSSEISWEVAELEKGQAFLASRFNISALIVDGRLRAVIDLKGLASINAALIAAGFELKTVSSPQQSLESLFLGLTGHQKIM